MTDLPARTPLWARGYLRAKDWLRESRVDEHAVGVGAVLLCLVAGYVGAAAVVVRLYPDTWRQVWLPTGVVVSTVLVSMAAVAAWQLADYHAEQYRQEWP